MHTRKPVEPCKTVRRSGSAPRAHARRVAPTAATFAASLTVGALSTTAIANPTGGSVVAGNGTISTPNASTTVIDQASQNLSQGMKGLGV